MESSNTSELGMEQPSTDAASTVEQVQNEVRQPMEAPKTEKHQTLEQKLTAIKESKGSLGEVDPAADEKTISDNRKAEVAEANGEKPVVAAATDKPAYEPNYKYKAFGKERELDPMFRDLIKDPESEKKVKEVFTRADAFDDMKSQKEAVSSEYQRLNQQHAALDKDVRRVANFINNGDVGNTLAALRISDDAVLNYLRQKAEVANLSPFQQQAFQQAQMQRMQEFDQQEQMKQLQENYANERRETRVMQLDYTLDSPDVSPQAQAWDAKMGQAGAFKHLVIETAGNHFRMTNQDLSPRDAVQLTLQKYGRLLEQPQASQAQVVPAANQQIGAASPQPVAQGAKPVIPAVAGRGASPIKQAPKSIKDLKRMGAEMAAREAGE
jgi:hypothetical protein